MSESPVDRLEREAHGYLHDIQVSLKNPHIDPSLVNVHGIIKSLADLAREYERQIAENGLRFQKAISDALTPTCSIHSSTMLANLGNCVVCAYQRGSDEASPSEGGRT